MIDNIERESFIFYRSFFEAIKNLKPKDQAVLFCAVCELALNGKEIELAGMNKTIFTLIKPQIEANTRRYLNGQKGKEFGKLGGAPKGNKNASKLTPRENQNNPKTTPNVNDNENVNDNDNENENENVNNDTSGGSSLSSSSSFSSLSYQNEFDRLYELYPVDGYRDRALELWIKNNYNQENIEQIFCSVMEYSKKLEDGDEKERTLYYFLDDEIWKKYVKKKEAELEDKYDMWSYLLDTHAIDEKDFKENMGIEYFNRYIIEKKFEEFYDIYPRKDDKNKAKSYWKKIVKDEDKALEIIKATKRYSEQYKGEEKFCKDPTAYLKDETWKTFIEKELVFTW